jgi:GNAT superfamily N-acetyltransferase
MLCEILSLPSVMDYAGVKINPASMSNCKIREALLTDSSQIAHLSDQLGYPAEPVKVMERMTRIFSTRDNCIFVAETDDQKVVGWIHGFLTQLVESELRAEIGGLIVGQAQRNKGIGRALLEAVEKWAAERKAGQVSARCNVKRLESHQFYEKLGYRVAKTQMAFRKSLP